MGNFTRTFSKTIEFDGDTISYTMKRLKRKKALDLAPYMTYDDDGNLKMTFEDQLKFVEVGATLLGDHLTEFSGLVVEGQEVQLNSTEFKEIFEEAYFMPLISELFNDLMSESFMDNDDVGKSEEGPSGTSKDSTTTKNTELEA